MGKLVMMMLALVLLSSAASAQTVTYGWEDGQTVLSLYGAGDPPIIVANVGAPDPVHGGASSLLLEDNCPSGTPQAYLAFIIGLQDGDEVTASFWRYDTTPSGSPSCRIWGHWNDTFCDIDGYDGSASGNEDYGPGTGWDETAWTYTVADGHTGLVIECRTYSNPGDSVYIDDMTITAPDHAVIFTPGSPPTGIDLEVSSVWVDIVGDSLQIGATVTLYTCDVDQDDVETAIEYLVDAAPFRTAAYVARDLYQGTCRQQAYDECNLGTCLSILRWDPVYMTGEVVEGTCTRSGFDCVCAYDSDESIPDKLEYVMQNNVTVTIDPEGMVPELNEMNNSMTVEIGPTATQPSTWGAIKSLYR